MTKPLSLKAKKTIAREIIVITSIGLACALFYAGIAINDYIQRRNRDNYLSIINQNEIKATGLRSVITSYNSAVDKRTLIYKATDSAFHLNIDYEQFERNIAVPENSRYMYNRLSTIFDMVDYNYFLQKLKPFLKKPAKSDSLNFESGAKLLKENELLTVKKNNAMNNIITYEGAKRYALEAFICLLIIAYPVRFFIRTLVWSIKTLKMK